MIERIGSASKLRRCTNAQPGTYNHECGQAAKWEGTHDTNGCIQHFCDEHKRDGWEARNITKWRRLD